MKKLDSIEYNTLFEFHCCYVSEAIKCCDRLRLESRMKEVKIASNGAQ